jgi:tRNA A-37 threonylcarbamoyl transferase component Bud32
LLLHKQTHLQVLNQYGLDAAGLLLQGKSQLENLSVVRHLPNRRLVCRGKWGDINVYFKLFFGKDYRRYAQRDETGVRYLTKANILTPALLHAEDLPDGKGCVLIFQEVANAENAETLWVQLNKLARLKLAKQLVKTIAQHHYANLLQTDLHLKNFLIKDEDVYTLDGDGIRSHPSLSQQHALENLSVLFSKFDVLEMENWLDDLLKIYSEACIWQALPNAALIKEMTNTHRQKAARDYADKKVFRQCSDVNITALRGLFIAASSDANINLPKNVVELEALIQPHNLLKNGNTCTVALTEIDNKKLVVKRYNIKNFWHGLSRAFRPSRAAASWANAHRLIILDIATARPIALYEQRKFSFLLGGLRGKAYFLAEHLDLPDVAEYFAQTKNKSQRAEAVKNIVTLFYRLYLLYISHGDMKATNIKMLSTQPALIDLDSMRQHRKTNSAAHVRDLQRFMQNWQNDNALYNAFVKTFKVVYPDDAMLIKAGIAINKE